MLTFSYAAIDADNVLTKGKIRAYSAAHARYRLRTDGLTMINMKRESSRFMKRIFGLSPIGSQDKIQLTRSLHTFLSSGLSLNRAITIAREQTTNSRLEAILHDVGKKINEGQSLGGALGPYVGNFSAYYVRMIGVGESSGMLDDTLAHLLKQQEKEYELSTSVRNAMIYPMFIVIAAAAAVIFLMTFVIPNIAAALASYGTELPLLTRALIAISDFLVAYWLYLAIAAVIVPLVFVYTLQIRRYKRFFESILLRTPIIKKIMIEFNNARIMRALWTPLRSGLNINRSLELVAASCGNIHYRESIEKSALLIRRGIPLSELLKAYKDLYPPSVYHMIEVGEKTGRLDDMLLRLSEYYEQSVHNTFKNFSSVIEPFLILFIGSVIGLIAVSVLTPIWRFSETI